MVLQVASCEVCRERYITRAVRRRNVEKRRTGCVPQQSVSQPGRHVGGNIRRRRRDHVENNFKLSQGRIIPDRDKDTDTADAETDADTEES